MMTPTVHGPALPRSAAREVPASLRAYRGPFIMRDGQRCTPSVPGVRAATFEQDIYAAAAVRCILASDAHLERVRAEREAAGQT